MSLLQRQIAFREEIAAPDDGMAPSSTGMAIYRDAYRGRLLAALELSFEQTRRWVGEEAFIAAAAHYILMRPPTGWTLDVYGGGFPDVLAELFREDPDVAELAWLEWQLQQAFAAPDRPVLDPTVLAATSHDAADWEAMRFAMAPGFAVRRITTDCVSLWRHLKGDSDTTPELRSTEGAVAVWRAGLSPRYRMMPVEEMDALERIAAGDPLGELGLHVQAEQLGAWLAIWFGEALFASAEVEQQLPG